MKKILITIILSILAIVAFAQTITIDDEIANSYQAYAPIFSYWEYSMSQMIYTSEELAEAGFTGGLITNIMFQNGSTQSLTNSNVWNIRMMETSETEFTQFIDPVGSTLVFNDNIGVTSLAQLAWVDITLSTPFVYSGSQNLFIQVVDTKSGWNINGSNPNFYGFLSHVTDGDFTITNGRDDDPYDLNDYTDWNDGEEYPIYVRPHLRLTYLQLTTGADLSVISFTGPAILTGATTNMVVSVMNQGTVAAPAYTIDILLEGNNTPLYTIPTEALPVVPLPNSGSVANYTITPAIYSLWTIAGVGDINLIARVNFTGQTDLVPLNNTKTLATYIMPPPITTFPFTETFEDGRAQWTIVNGTQTNKWHWGTAVAAPGGGTHSMYISNDNGVTNAYTNNSATWAHFYSDITFPAGTTAIALSFDYRGVGETSEYDYLIVRLVPTTTTPAAGSAVSGGNQIGTTLYNIAQWTNYQLAIPTTSNVGEPRRLVFSWRNDGSLGNNPPAAVDNIKITTYTQTDPPLAARLGTSAPADNANYISTEPTLTWQVPATGNTPVGYKVYLEDHTPVPGTDTAKATVLAGATFTYTPGTALTNGTKYYWMVVPYITSGEEPNITEIPAVGCPVWTFNTIMAPHTVLPFTDDFESGSAKWNIENGTQTNKWKLGTATASVEDEHSMYISYNDNQNLYDNTVASNVHFFTDITFPEDITGVVVKFDYKGNGQSTGGSDDLRVFLAPTSVIPAAGTAPSTTNQIGSTYVLTPSWTTAEINLAGSTYEDSTRRLIFSWRNDAANGAQPPMAVDNVSVRVTLAGQPPLAARISSPANNATNVSLTPTLTWLAPSGGNIPSSTLAGGYKLYYGTAQDPTTNTPIDRAYNELNYAITTALDPTETYYWMVVPYITVGDPGDTTDIPAVNCPVWSFTTLTPEPGIVNIGTGTSGVAAPLQGTYDFTVSQVIYTASELAEVAGSVITNISYQTSGAFSTWGNHNGWLIYMGETATSTFTADNWIALSEMEQVFRGVVATGSSSAGDWINITLDTPFSYSGTDNLVIFVNEYTPGWQGGSQFRGTSTSPDNRTIRNYRDSSSAGDFYIPEGPTTWTTGSYSAQVDTNRPNIRINYITPTTGLDLAVTGFTGPANLTGDSDFTVTVTNYGTDTVAATDYEIVISEVGGTFEYTILAGDDGYIPFTAPFQTTEFVIESDVYETWMVTRGTTIDGVGHVTLKAEVVITDDDDEENNFLTHTLYVVPAYDLAITKFAVPGVITLPTTVATIAFEITNNGGEDIGDDEYEITLFIDGVDSGITILSKDIEGGDTELFEVTATQLSSAGITARNEAITLKLEVTLLGSLDDELPLDNEVEVEIFVADALSTVTVVGDDKVSTIPFSTGSHDNVIQSIYKPADLGGVAYGLISQIMYKFERTTGELTPYPVNIYMVNTDKAKFASTTDWVPEGLFTQVVADYDLGLTEYPAGIHEIWIPLDEPFLYTGGNLVIMTHKDHEASIATSNVFFQTETVAESSVTLDKSSTVPGNNYELSLTAGTGTVRNFKPQTGFAFDLHGTTDLGDIAVAGFTGPVFIPAAADQNMVITLRNLSTLVSIDATDYTVIISEEIPNANPLLPSTWNPITTIENDTDDFPTVDIAPGSFAAGLITIPSSEYNSWNYLNQGGIVTLKAEIAFESTFTDTESGNDEALFTTELAPAKMVMELAEIVIPPFIPSVEDISVKLSNVGRAVIANNDYTLELYETYWVPGEEEGDEPEYFDNLLYKWGITPGADALAQGIAMGASREYEIENTIYNGWDFDSAPGEEFYLTFILTYTNTDGVQVIKDSLATQTRPQYDLQLAEFAVPAQIPSPTVTKLTLKVQNNGREAVDAGAYTIAIKERVMVPGAEPTDPPTETWPTVYTIPATAALALDLGEAQTHEITWTQLFTTDAFAATNGAISIKAEVIEVVEGSAEPQDEYLDNNAITHTTSIAHKYDLEVLPLLAPTTVPTFADVTIPVRNNGRYPVAATAYDVELYRVVGTTETLLYTFGDGADADDDAVALGIAESTSLIIPVAELKEAYEAIPTGAFNFKAVVVYTADAVAGNNTQTRAATKSALPVDGIAEVGIANTNLFVGSAGTLPFSTYYYDGVTQSIYSQQDLSGLDTGLITHINYRYNRTAGSALSSDGSINIYMANADKPTGFTSTSNWVPYSEFTLVKSNFTLTSTVGGINEIWLALDTPFLYQGQDLIVYTHKSTSGGYNTTDGFYQTAPVTDSHISLSRAADNPTFTNVDGTFNVEDPANGTSSYAGIPTRYDYKPQMRFAINIGEFGRLTGTITDGTGPVSGVSVAQVGGGTATSVTNGNYVVYVDKSVGSAAVTFTKYGYYSATVELSSVTSWVTGTDGISVGNKDVVLTPLPATTVKGTVTYIDSGNGVAGVVVHFGSFASAATTATGEYEIAGVYYGFDYEVTVTGSTPGFQPYSQTVTVAFEADEDDDEFVYDIELEEVQIQPLFVSAKVLGNGDRNVRWFNPGATFPTVTHQFYDTTSTEAYTYNFTMPVIAFSRFTQAQIALKGLEGALLKSVSFRTGSSVVATDVFKIVIWNNVNTAVGFDPNVPDYEQDVTGVTYNSVKEVTLNELIPIPETGELWIGVYASLGSRLIVYRGTMPNEFYQLGNYVILDQGQGLQLYVITNSNADNWAIRSTFMVEPARGNGDAVLTFNEEELVETQSVSDVFTAEMTHLAKDKADRTQTEQPTQRDSNTTNTRAFSATYNVYRLAADAALTPSDIKLNSAPIAEASFVGNYLDNVLDVANGSYRYAVTALYTGENYPGGVFESAPVYTNNVTITKRYLVEGTVTRIAGTVEGFIISFTNEDAGYSPENTTTDDNGDFSFIVPAGNYVLKAWWPTTPASQYVSGTIVVPDGLPLDDIPLDALGEDDISIPAVTALKGNYPNPFNPSTTIAFDLAEEGLVSIDVFNIKGQKVKTVTNELMKAGRYSVVWNGDDNIGRAVGSGVYFYRMTSGQYTKTQKMLLMK